jgi:23S rRNA (guanine745-N1)-methyltransferase
VLADVVDALCCPHCGQPLALDAGTARCPAGHAFDVARQGHLNLLTRPAANTGDTAAMVAARTEFLATGNYAPIRDALVADAEGAGLVVELGAGTAYYLAGVVDGDAGRTGLALDVSPYAARRAAKAHPRIGSVVCDAWQRLPVRDAAASVVLNVFAPRNPSELARILAPGGSLLVVTPNPEHLRELVGALGLVTVDEDKDRRLETTLGSTFARTDAHRIEWPMTLSHATATQLVAMGPSAWHTTDTLADLADPVQVTASVTLSRWVPRLRA